MTWTPNAETPTRRPLRLWPGVTILLLQWLARFVVPRWVPDLLPFAMPLSLLGGALLLLWWLFASRAPGSERLGALALMAIGVALTHRLAHPSIAAAGAMGWWVVLGFTVPLLSLALVLWAATPSRLAGRRRWALLAAGVAIACGVWTLLRTGGVTGAFEHDLSWRWSATAEDRLLARDGEPGTHPPAAAVAPSVIADWPGFRGAARDGVVHGVRIATDWATAPPTEIWRRPVGPGWSSFAVDGDLFYTQEQRGEEETVACYRTSDGTPVWRHADPTRFWEPAAGAGPRATPALAGGFVVSLGATGILNVLDAGNGEVVWSRHAAREHEVELPEWGFAGSPRVVGDLVVVALSGRLAAYDLATGTPRWTVPSDGGGYSSPHLARLDGVDQVLLQRGRGMVSVLPSDGTVLWRHPWPGVAIVQPAVLPDGSVLLSDRDNGMRRLALTPATSWTAEESWTSIGIKPFFNDFVVHQGHVYGFDGRMLASVDVADGKRRWKGGRYGNGQLILLADQGLLLVLGEKGELALVTATPERFEEVARLPGAALHGKTWNHPVLVGDVLLIRNDREMAALRLRRVEG